MYPEQPSQNQQEKTSTQETSAEDDAHMLSEIPIFKEMLQRLKDKLAQLGNTKNSEPHQPGVNALRQEIAELEEQIQLREEYQVFFNSQPDKSSEV